MHFMVLMRAFQVETTQTEKVFGVIFAKKPVLDFSQKLETILSVVEIDLASPI